MDQKGGSCVKTWRAFSTYLRDLILFGVGVAIILKQSGILLEPPPGGVHIEVLFIGALFCNGPLMLQYLSLRRGTGMPLPPGPAELPASPSALPSVSSSEGDP